MLSIEGNYLTWSMENNSRMELISQLESISNEYETSSAED